MPPRSLSASNEVGIAHWDDSDIYESSEDVKSRTKGTVTLTKSVKITDHREVFFIEHIDEFSEEDVAAIWYDANEYAAMKTDYKATVFLMECGKPLSNDEQTCRGLEYRSQAGAWARYENKRDAYNAVLDEQDIQWKKDVDDCDALSRVYLLHSTKCQEAAVVLGRQDAAEAQNIYEECFSKAKHAEKIEKRISRKKSGNSLKRMCGIKV